jgi:hypothetical protein
MLHSITDARNKISDGKPLLLAASEWALNQLPRGNWIGGTIPYFMDASGGICSESLVFIDEVPDCATGFGVRVYNSEEIPASLAKDVPENGYSFLIVPGQSEIHAAYAQTAPDCDRLVEKAVVGWVSGVNMARLELDLPKVFDGVSGEVFSDRAVAMHITLPTNKRADIDVVNIFKPGIGDEITFPTSGFRAVECAVNGIERSFPDYMLKLQPDPQVPLVGEHNGRLVNVGIQGFEETTRAIQFYAPVFPGVKYRFAKPVSDYIKAFTSALSERKEPAVFSCNCILNYFYAELEGKQTGTVTGPITFGEIAHQLLNQTLIRLLIRDI